MKQRMRLDKLLVGRGLARTRSHAQDLIRRGQVRVDDAVPHKAGAEVDAQARLEVLEAADYVSRGALKLKGALAAFGFPVEGRVALDAGASTGGFTQVLLREGAVRVYAVDVGTGQLDAGLRTGPRIVNLEKTDIRALTPVLVPEAVSAITVDVSFISLLKVLPSLSALSAPGAWIIALIKPQFEVGPDHVGKGGIVGDEAEKQAAVERIVAWFGEAGWRVAGVIPSPILGREGNEEFLIGAERGG